MEAQRASARREGGGEGWRPEELGPKGRGPDQEKVRAPRVGVRRVGARRRRAQNFAFFFPSPAPISLFFSLSGGLVEFWWCLKRRGPEMCTFGLSGCRVKPWRIKKNENCGGGGQKKKRNCGRSGGVLSGGCPAEGCPAEGLLAEMGCRVRGSGGTMWGCYKPWNLGRVARRRPRPSARSGHALHCPWEALGSRMAPSAFWASWADALPGAAGVSHDSPRAQMCTFERPGLQKHHQNSTKRTTKREKEECKLWREEGKKARNFGRSGGGLSSGGLSSGRVVQRKGCPAEGLSSGRVVQRKGCPAEGLSSGRVVQRKGCPAEGLSSGRVVQRKGCPAEGLSSGRVVQRKGCPAEGLSSGRVVQRKGCPAEGLSSGKGCPAEGLSSGKGCPAEGSIGNGVQGFRGFGFSSGFGGRKQKQHRNKMKREMNKNKKKVKKSKNKAEDKKKKERKKETEQTPSVRLRPTNFDFGQFRLRPLSTSATFDFGQLAEVELSEVELAEVEHPQIGLAKVGHYRSDRAQF